MVAPAMAPGTSPPDREADDGQVVSTAVAQVWLKTPPVGGRRSFRLAWIGQVDVGPHDDYAGVAERLWYAIYRKELKTYEDREAGTGDLISVAGWLYEVGWRMRKVTLDDIAVPRYSSAP